MRRVVQSVRVPHPDQGNLPPGALRFVMSLRATGEGHISSIEFREGVINADNSIHIEPTNRFVSTPELVSDPTYDKPLFLRKLEEMGFHGGITSEILDPLPEEFNLKELNNSLVSYNAVRPTRARPRCTRNPARWTTSSGSPRATTRWSSMRACR